MRVERVPVGAVGSSVYDELRDDDAPLNLTGSTVRFRTRRYDSSTLVTDQVAAIEDADDGRVRYDFLTGDVASAAELLAWWRVSTGGGAIHETPEFLLVVYDHVPGGVVRTGAVAERVRATIPETWAALRGSELYGDVRLQERVDLVKYELLATSCAPSAEASLLDPIVLDYLGKLATLRVIPAAIDYWANQPTQRAVQNPRESLTYPDRIKALQSIQERLLSEVAADRAIVSGIVGVQVRTRVRQPSVDTDGAVVTDDPARFPRASRTTSNGRLPWSS